MPRKFDNIPVQKAEWEDWLKSSDYEDAPPDLQEVANLIYDGFRFLEAQAQQEAAMAQNATTSSALPTSRCGGPSRRRPKPSPRSVRRSSSRSSCSSSSVPTTQASRPSPSSALGYDLSEDEEDDTEYADEEDNELSQLREQLTALNEWKETQEQSSQAHQFEEAMNDFLDEQRDRTRVQNRAGVHRGGVGSPRGPGGIAQVPRRRPPQPREGVRAHLRRCAFW
jgi:hypothetical protein